MESKGVNKLPERHKENVGGDGNVLYLDSGGGEGLQRCIKTHQPHYLRMTFTLRKL